MSGFDKDWLRLREPADRAARSSSLLETVSKHVASLPAPRTIMDIGCGTGSTFRTLTPVLPKASWRLLDYEATLLEEAKRQIGPRDAIEFHCADLNTLDESLLDDVSIVTASALFDLCSDAFCQTFIERLARKQIGIYAALNYDGAMEWSVRHSLDEQVTQDFNQHQRSDKGFGPALGPDATSHLCNLCSAAGFVVETASSPWRLDPVHAGLQREFLAGLSRPIQEIGNIDEADFDDWLEFRLSHIGVERSVCVVGHADFLAIPQK